MTESNEASQAAPVSEQEAPAAEATSAPAAAPRSGGQAVVEKYGREYMSALGKRGSRAVIRKYGLKYFSEIAARNKGVPKRRKPAPETGS